ncbi:Leucine Rich Repeat [Seminavis robusta]|uniref:Leucine Rich Repeat n=1 Tax=Seminavis robusta TaxID=568900 RepID=A0A9N8EBK7_9STRA|nr:Leucine Rich Repeat [Seminavis robusta]|eukprot:Sro853_g211190.1 Leucine Rich Repeat (842) ;mRNA; f:40889-43414
MDRKNTRQFPAADRERVVSEEEGEVHDEAFPKDIDLVAGCEDLRLSKLVAARITTSISAAADQSEEEGEVHDPAFPTDLDWVDGSEDLRLSKLVAARLCEAEESQQNENQVITPSLTPTKNTAVYASTNGPKEDSEKPAKRAHDQSKSSDPSMVPTKELLMDDRIDAGNPSGMENSYGTNNGTQETSSEQQDSLPGAYALAPPGVVVAAPLGVNNNGSNGVNLLPQSEHHPGVPSLDNGPTMVSSSSSIFDGGIPVANLVSNDHDNTIPEAEPEDIEAQMGRRKQRERMMLRMGALSLAFFLMALGLVLVMVLFMVSKGQKTDIERPVSTVSPSAPPSMPPSQRRQSDSALQLFPNYTKVMLDDLESAQYHAYQWLLGDIEMHDNRLADERILQRFALATLYMSTNGDSWFRNENWLNHSVHECFWYSNDQFLDFEDEDYEYVQVIHTNPCEMAPTNNTDVSVLPGETEDMYVHLWLANKKLEGTIPPEVFWLTHLRSISFYNNDGLGGSIPSLIGQLTSLEAINMGGTAISGVLPSELGLLSDTTHSIAIINAQLEGRLPSELGLLHRMHDLLLDQNGFTGVLPEELGNVSSLEWIYLSDNSFTGTLPVSMVQLPLLQQLYLDGNQFSGAMPTEIGLLSDIDHLVVYRNRFTGTIPTQVAQMSSASNLDFDDCYFTGTLPSELGLLTKMTQFWAAGNSLTGTISTEIAQNLNLEYFIVSENHFSGTIPTEFGQIVNLDSLSLSNNNLSGSLPHGLSSNIDWLEVSNNTLLTGPLPTSLINLNWVWLTGTQISGVLPGYVCDIETLAFDCSSILCGCDCTCSNNTNSTAANILARKNETVG